MASRHFALFAECELIRVESRALIVKAELGMEDAIGACDGAADTPLSSWTPDVAYPVDSSIGRFEAVRAARGAEERAATRTALIDVDSGPDGVARLWFAVEEHRLRQADVRAAMDAYFARS